MENPPYSEFLVSFIFDKLYHRANLPPSLRPIARFALELEHFVCDHIIPTTKFYGPKALLCTCIAFPYTMCLLEVNVDLGRAILNEHKVKLVLNLVVDNESHFFLNV